MRPADPKAVHERFMAIVARADAELKTPFEAGTSPGQPFGESPNPSQWFIESPDALAVSAPLLGVYQDDDSEVRA